MSGALEAGIGIITTGAEVVEGLGSTLKSMGTKPKEGKTYSESVGENILGSIAEIKNAWEPAKTWLTSKETAREYDRYTEAYMSIEAWKNQRDAIKQLEGKHFEHMEKAEHWEKKRLLGLEIMETDRSELTSKFTAQELAQFGLSADTIDAETMIEKRGGRRMLEGQQEAMSRQMSRSGVYGSAALGAAQSQLGLQAAQGDAQMGLLADQEFQKDWQSFVNPETGHMSNVLEKYFSAKNNMLTEQWDRQQKLQQAEEAFKSGTIKAVGQMLDWENLGKQKDTIKKQEELENKQDEIKDV